MWIWIVIMLIVAIAEQIDLHKKCKRSEEERRYFEEWEERWKEYYKKQEEIARRIYERRTDGVGWNGRTARKKLEQQLLSILKHHLEQEQQKLDQMNQ